MPVSKKQIEKYLEVVTGAKAKVTSDKILLPIEDKTEALRAIQRLDDAGIMEIGTVSGITYKSTSYEKPVYKTEMVKDQISLPACWEGDIPEDTYSPQEVFDHNETMYSTYLEFVASQKRQLDIVYSKGVMAIIADCLDMETLKSVAEAEVLNNPDTALPRLVDQKKVDDLTQSFNAVRALKPLAVEQVANDNEVHKLQAAYNKAVSGVKKAVADSGILDVLPEEKVRALVKRAAGLDIL